jgi:hypothetical protein
VALRNVAQRSYLDSRYNIESESHACSCGVHIAIRMIVFRKCAALNTGYPDLRRCQSRCAWSFEPSYAPRPERGSLSSKRWSSVGFLGFGSDNSHTSFGSFCATELIFPASNCIELDRSSIGFHICVADLRYGY